MRTKKEVLDWFKRHNVLNRFFRNWKNYPMDGSPRTYNDIFERKSKIINYAFRWSSTPEEYDFWDDLSEEFNEWY